MNNSLEYHMNNIIFRYNNSKKSEQETILKLLKAIAGNKK